MVIVQKQYLPFVENWNGSTEYPRKPHESNHVGCRFYNEIDGIRGRCTRRDVVVIKSHLHCVHFKDRDIQFEIGSTSVISIGSSVNPNIN